VRACVWSVMAAHGTVGYSWSVRPLLHVVHDCPGRFVPPARLPAASCLDIYCRFIVVACDGRTHEQFRLDRPRRPVGRSVGVDTTDGSRACRRCCSNGNSSSRRIRICVLSPVFRALLLCSRRRVATALAFYGKRFPRSNVEHTLNSHSAVSLDKISDSVVLPPRGVVRLRSIDN